MERFECNFTLFQIFYDPSKKTGRKVKIIFQTKDTVLCLSISDLENLISYPAECLNESFFLTTCGQYAL